MPFKFNQTFTLHYVEILGNRALGKRKPLSNLCQAGASAAIGISIAIDKLFYESEIFSV